MLSVIRKFFFFLMRQKVWQQICPHGSRSLNRYKLRFPKYQSCFFPSSTVVGRVHFTDNEWAWQRCGLRYPQCTAHRCQKSCFLGSLVELWSANFLLFDEIMHLSGAMLGEIGHGQGPGAGPAPGTCNPRKFSEKIALHNQRQAEDTAAFREVMMDITSIRVSLLDTAHVRRVYDTCHIFDLGSVIMLLWSFIDCWQLALGTATGFS